MFDGQRFAQAAIFVGGPYIKMTESTLSQEQVAHIVAGVLRLGRRLRAQRPADSVSLSALSLMATLNEQGPMPAARLAERQRLQPQSLTRLIQDLEGKGLIARTPGPDRRTFMLSLTPEGVTAFRYDIAARQRWLRDEMARLLPADDQVLLAVAASVMLKLTQGNAVGDDEG
jgi:DNA-binding MarR family transcriptional regulator